jgi:uncharacterized membrane protein
VAYDINSRGEVVGSVEVAQVGTRAAYWDSRGVLSVLEPLEGHDNIAAFAINDRGEMAGTLENENSPSFAITWNSNHAIRHLGPPNLTQGVSTRLEPPLAPMCLLIQ